MGKYRNIIWDWNGTLLNDVWLGIEVMNSLLENRKLHLLTIEKYRDIFDFPVKNYYAKLGFDFEQEPFEVIGNEFITEYDKKHLLCKLNESASEILKFISNIGINQYVLSARNHLQLENEFEYFGIRHYFKSFAGLSDNLANGKLKLGMELIKNQKIDKKSTVLIGDTVHDYEVAEALEIDCILVEGGHQSAERLKQCGAVFMKNLSYLRDYLNT